MFTVTFKQLRNGSIRLGQIHSADCAKCGKGQQFATYEAAAAYADSRHAAPVPEVCITDTKPVA